MPDDPDKKRAEKKSDPTTSDPKPTRQTSLPPTSPIDSKKRTQGSTKPNQIPGPDASLLRKLSVKSTTSTPSSFAPIPGIRSKLDETKSPIEAVPTKPPQPRFNRPGFLGARGSPSSRGLRGRGRGGYTGRSYPYEYEPSEADTEATDDFQPHYRPNPPPPRPNLNEPDSDTSDDGKPEEPEDKDWERARSSLSWRDSTDTESLTSSEQTGFGPPGFRGNFGPPGASTRGGWGRGVSFRGDSADEASRGGYRGRGFFRGRGGFGDSSDSSRGGFRGRGFFENSDSPRGGYRGRGFRGWRGEAGDESFRGSFRGRGRGRGRGAQSLISEAGNPASWRQDSGYHAKWVTMAKNWKDRAPDGAEPEWVHECGELVAEILLENLDSDDEEEEGGEEGGEEGKKKEEGGGGGGIRYRIDPSEVESVASYTWVKPNPDDPDDVPTILVPGAPPTFHLPTSTLSLPPDSGTYLRDINHTRTPYPLEPAIRSLLTLHPNYPTCDIDLVLCASTMSKLIWFCLSRSWNFRFNVELVGNTVFFQRNEGKRGEIIPDVMGYGHGYVEATTRWEGGGRQSLGESHQRLVAYTFAGLRIMVRFESDGYLPSLLPHSAPRRKSMAPDESDLLNLFSDLSLSADPPMRVAPPPKLPIYKNSPPQAGTRPDSPPKSPIETQSPLLSTPTLRIFTTAATTTPIPHAPLLDLKTRSGLRPIEMDEVLLRLWVNRTPNFVIAYHRVGTFEPEATEVMDVRGQVGEWEEKNRECLVRLGKVLREVVGMVRESRGRRWEVRRVLDGPLQVRRPWEGKPEEEEDEGERSVLPEMLKARWVDGF